MDQRSVPFSSGWTTRKASLQLGVQENVGVAPGVTARLTGPEHSGNSSGPISSEQPGSQTRLTAPSSFQARNVGPGYPATPAGVRCGFQV